MYNTLIEYNLYLYKAAVGSGDETTKKTLEKRILDILESDTANYDSDQVEYRTWGNPGKLGQQKRVCGLLN